MGNFFQILLFITIWPRQTESQGCATISGPDPNKPCIFPFKFGDITYNNCTTIGNEPGNIKAWCSTKVDDSGKHIGNGQGNWGDCEQYCQNDFKTPTQLKYLCNSLPNSKWMNNKCYHFQDKEVQNFNDAQMICSDIFKSQGFDNGRLYEPRSTKDFQMVYKLAEDFSKRKTVTIWLGMEDNKNEGIFTYSSDKKNPNFTLPWGARQPNGGRKENCLTSFSSKKNPSPLWYDRPCIEKDTIDEVGHRFMCECEVEGAHSQAQTDQLDDEDYEYDSIFEDVGGLSVRFTSVSKLKKCAGQMKLNFKRKALKLKKTSHFESERAWPPMHAKMAARIKSVKIEGDCCWELKSKDGNEIQLMHESDGLSGPRIINISLIHYITARHIC